MMDANEDLAEESSLKKFVTKVDLLDTVAMMNPELETDTTYLWSKRRIDYAFITPGLRAAVVKAGHHPFHQHLVTDHKGVFVYFLTDVLFDSSEIDGSHISQRRLDLGKRTTVERYVKKLEELYEHHRILGRLNNIECKLNRVKSLIYKEALLRKLDKLDAERVALMVAAEKRAGRPPSNGKYEWSPSLEKAGRRVTYWKLRLHETRQGHVNPDRVQRLHRELKINKVARTKVEVRKCLNEAWAELKQIQKRHLEHREEHMAKLAEFYAGQRDTTAAQEIKKLIHIEGVKRIATKHRWYLKGKKGMLKQLLVQNFLVYRMPPVYASWAVLAMLGICFQSERGGPPYQKSFYERGTLTDGLQRSVVLCFLLWSTYADWNDMVIFDGWKPLSDEQMIHKRLLRRNATHLSLSRNTPFAMGPLADAVGRDGEKPAVEELLSGTFKWEGDTGVSLLDGDVMKAFLKALQRPTSQLSGGTVPDISPVITEDDYVRMFNKTRESTASHPPIHYGHFKAACESKDLLQVNLKFMNLPFCHGIPLTRWLRSLHCMIQKDDLPFITRLRIVQLYEADFNSVLKLLLGRRLMHHSEEHKLNSPQLYGSRKGKSTHEALITLRILYDLSRMDRCYMVSLFNDLRGCYDRIRPSLNTITARRMGCPTGVAVCHANAVRRMRHRVRTAAGLSKGEITWDAVVNHGGIGQGNGAGPQSYHSQLLPQVEAYEALTNQDLKFSNPDGSLNFFQWLLVFPLKMLIILSFSKWPKYSFIKKLVKNSTKPAFSRKSG